MITLSEIGCEIERLRKDLTATKATLAVVQAALPVTGTTTLVAGTVDIADTDIATTSKVYVSYLGTQDTPGFLNVTLDDGVGFTIDSTDNADVSEVAYIIYY